MTEYSIPVKNLDAVTSVSNGSATDLDGVGSDHAMQYVAVFSETCEVNIVLQGSLDGSNWYSLVDQAVSGVNGNTKTGILSVTGKPARYTRARVNDYGACSATTVTAWITSKR